MFFYYYSKFWGRKLLYSKKIHFEYHKNRFEKRFLTGKLGVKNKTYNLKGGSRTTRPKPISSTILKLLKVSRLIGDRYFRKLEEKIEQNANSRKCERIHERGTIISTHFCSLLLACKRRPRVSLLSLKNEKSSFFVKIHYFRSIFCKFHRVIIII